MMQENFKITPIGMIQGKENTITIDAKYCKGLKHLSKFSHAILLYKDEEAANILHTNLHQKAVKLLDVDENKGILEVEHTKEMNASYELYDIKPYFPNEDRVLNAKAPTIVNTPSPSLHPQQLSKMGTIRKIKGSYYLEIQDQFNEYMEALNGYSHIKVIWWFHKFEKDIYKRTLLCDPPYENAPKTGIFASRSPVRPNPFAITTVRIIEIDKNSKRIKVSLMDCFDATPLLGICPYHPACDSIEDTSLPTWVEHWSAYLDDRDFETYPLPTLLPPSKNRITQYLETPTPSTSIHTNYFNKNNKKSIPTLHHIEIKGAKQHNLKNIDVAIPYNKVTVMTGVSGSGKSSLAFDTIFAESQQRFFSTMSLSERSRLSIMEKPMFDTITGLPPAIAISQNSYNRNPRSTVGTATDLYSLLRNLFATIGIRHCPECGHAITKMTAEEIIAYLLQCKKETELTIYPFNQKEDKKNITILTNEDNMYKTYVTEVKEAVHTSLTIGKGALQVQFNHQEELTFQTTEKCYVCDHLLFEMTVSDFSFNNPESMCPICNGLGTVNEINDQSIIKYPEKSILDGASEFWGSLRKFQKSPNANWMKGEILALADDMHLALEKPWNALPEAFRTQAIYGSGEREVSFSYKNKNGRTGTITRPVEGAYHILQRLLKSSTSDSKYTLTEQFTISKPCPCCHGERLKIESRMVTIANKRFPEIINMSIEQLKNWITQLPTIISPSEKELVHPLLQELYEKLDDYINIGLDYLTLDRAIPTLSGGEVQRIHLVSQLNSGISNILYILDEPTAGLHPKDYEMLLDIIHRLKEQHNTIIIVEHAPAIMRKADYILDIGPEAGSKGGYIIAQGSPQEIMNMQDSITGQYLSGLKKLTLTHQESHTLEAFVLLYGVQGNNLQKITMQFPLHAITCITGVSGSGKSSLVKHGILPAVTSCIERTTPINRSYEKIIGAETIHKIVHITQKAIGRSSRSTPATYTGVMDELRTIYMRTPDAIEHGFSLSNFSYNTKEGQCPACHGLGYKVLDNANAFSNQTVCPLCKGQKFHSTTLNVTHKGKNIAQVLDMSVKEALAFFKDHKKIKDILQMLDDIGLGYLSLGQSSQTLSGGEAQRIKLATDLILNSTNNTLYLLDEPTTGLHFTDIQNLLHMLSKIVAAGNTVILVEHNLDVIKNADWIIDLGPGGGIHGGKLIAQGTPSDIMNSAYSVTGKLLKSI